MNPESSDWTEEHSRLAETEGWGLFVCSGILRLQRDDLRLIFAGDEPALAHVRQRALEGSGIHRLALRLNGLPVQDESPNADASVLGRGPADRGPDAPR
jgi:hypothetical protein